MGKGKTGGEILNLTQKKKLSFSIQKRDPLEPLTIAMWSFHLCQEISFSNTPPSSWSLKFQSFQVQQVTPESFESTLKEKMPLDHRLNFSLA